MHARARVYTCIHTTKFKELEDGEWGEGGGGGGEQKFCEQGKRDTANQRSEGGQEERESESERKNVSHRLYDYEA